VDTALLIIDVQQALSCGDDEVFDSRGVIDRINRVSRLARSVGALVIVIQHESPAGPLKHGTEGWQLEPALETSPSDTRIRKTATDSFHDTQLLGVLQARGIKRLVICGFQSEFCVDTTTRRALALGYPVTLVADGHSTLDNRVLKAAQISAHHNETLSNIESFGPRAQAVSAADVRIDA